MLNDEEREAIEWLKINLGESIKLSQKYGLEKAIKNQKLILNLIEKQSKEIEELKERYERANKRYLKSLQEKDDKCEKLLEYVETEKETEYISKDKIKAKIEEWNDKGMTIYLGTRSYGKTFQQVLREEIKKVLQSLLEKE